MSNSQQGGASYQGDQPYSNYPGDYDHGQWSAGASGHQSFDPGDRASFPSQNILPHDGRHQDIQPAETYHGQHQGLWGSNQFDGVRRQ